MKYCKGCYYHLYNRGCNREDIFVSERNYTFLLYRVKEYSQTYSLSLIAYCLMPNHYHLLVRPEEDDSVPPFMQRLFNSYTQAFNWQQERSGVLFEGRYQSVVVDRDEYLRHLCRYIHRNPVEAGLVSEPGRWPYSNYREFVGTRGGTLVDRTFVNDFFGSPYGYELYVRNELPAASVGRFDAYKID